MINAVHFILFFENLKISSINLELGPPHLLPWKMFQLKNNKLAYRSNLNSRCVQKVAQI